MRYEKFTEIEDSSRLAAFFNSIMHRLFKMRMLCAPISFKRDEEISDFQDEKFCDFCRYETWMHEVVSKLRHWEKETEEYFSEFETDEDYKYYTIVSELYYDNWKDIVQDTKAEDLRGLCADLIANSRIDYLEGLKKFFGCDLMPYKMEGNDIRPMSREEHELDMALEQADAEDDSTRLFGVAGSIMGIFMVIKSCDRYDDNVEKLQMVSSMAKALLDMNFDGIHKTMKIFDEKYAEGK